MKGVARESPFNENSNPQGSEPLNSSGSDPNQIKFINCITLKFPLSGSEGASQRSDPISPNHPELYRVIPSSFAVFLLFCFTYRQKKAWLMCPTLFGLSCPHPFGARVVTASTLLKNAPGVFFTWGVMTAADLLCKSIYFIFLVFYSVLLFPLLRVGHSQNLTKKKPL